MNRNRLGGYTLIALTALLFGFLLAGQLRIQLINPSNRVERNQALLNSVMDLERTNASARRLVSALRAEIAGLEGQAAQRSESTRSLQQEVDGLRAHAGVTPLRGPGVTVQLANGRPGSAPAGRSAYLVNFQDVQDVVNALWEGGAEGVSVSGRRITPASAFRGSGSALLIDQGPPLTSPFTIKAVGNRNQMEQVLGDPASLGDLKLRQRQFQLQMDWSGGPDVSLPAYDSNLEVTYAQPI